MVLSTKNRYTTTYCDFNLLQTLTTLIPALNKPKNAAKHRKNNIKCSYLLNIIIKSVQNDVYLGIITSLFCINMPFYRLFDIVNHQLFCINIKNRIC